MQFAKTFENETREDARAFPARKGFLKNFTVRLK